MLIKNANVITPDGILKNTDVLTHDGVIAEIGKINDGGEKVLDATSLYVSPGFIDIHTHGGGGGDFMDCEDGAVRSALKFHAENGVTSLLATSVTASVKQTVDMINFTRNYIGREDLGCRILGVHLEGPYLSLKNKGAQHPAFLRVPEKDSYLFMLENRDAVRRVTIAPELAGAPKMISELTAAGIVVSGGHDDAGYADVLNAMAAGMSHTTHHWCAMSTVSMRNGVRTIGLTEAALLHRELTVEIIADNHHITPEMVQLIYSVKGADGMCAVSDSLRAGGMPPSNTTLYTLGVKTDENAQKFIVSDGVARLPDGSRYAGSIQPLGQMLKNLVLDAKIPLADAVKILSTTPAKIIGQDDIGSIEVGKKADFCLFDDKLNIKATLLGRKGE